MAPVSRLVRMSHERFDGRGYPDRRRGNEIALGARIIAVCDAYHAMTSDRPYRSAMPGAEAFAELRRVSGSQFDPEVVEAFCAALGEGSPDSRVLGEA
jgi:HD-GYP domain-containing protein (c-di-GMP phosphodiesterase class II)